MPQKFAYNLQDLLPTLASNTIFLEIKFYTIYISICIVINYDSNANGFFLFLYFLNHPGVWFLKIAFIQEAGMHVCLPPRLILIRCV